MNKISDKERFILLVIFSALVFIFSAFGLFQTDINPLLKLLPFLGISIYVFIKK